MSRSRRLFEAYGLSLVYQALTAVVGLFVTRYVLHRIGEADNALWVIGGQFLGYLVLLDLGVIGLLPREVGAITGKPADEGTRNAEVRDLVGRSISLALLLTPFLAIGTVVIVAALPTDWEALRWPLALSLGSFVVTYPLRVAHGLLTGLQDLRFLSWLQIASWVANVASTIALVHFHFGLYAVALGPAVGLLASSVGWMVRVLSTYAQFIPRAFHRLDWKTIRAQLGPGLWVSLSQISVILVNSTDVVFIGRILGPEAVNRFAFTDKLQTFFNNQPYQIALMAGPALSEVKASGDKPRIVRAVGAITVVVLVVSGGIVAAILAINHAFVRLWIGEEHFAGMWLTASVLANMLVRHWAFMYLNALFYFGHERACTLISIADGVVSALLMVIFLHWFGLPGAALGPLVSSVIVQFPATLWLLGQDIGRSPTSLLASQMAWAVRFLPIALAAWAVGRFLSGRSLALAIGAGAVVGILYLVLMLPLMRRPPVDVYAEPLLRKLGLAKRAPAVAPEA